MMESKKYFWTIIAIIFSALVVVSAVVLASYIESYAVPDIDDANVAENTEVDSGNLNIDTSKYRPVWALSHMCNKEGNVKWAINEKKCNGVEIDVSIRQKRENGKPVFDGNKPVNEIILKHGPPYIEPTYSCRTLEDFFKECIQAPGLCFVMLDIKSSLKTKENMVFLCDEVHKLTDKYGLHDVYFDYGLMAASEAQTLFPEITGKLRPKEGISIDYEKSAAKCEEVFQKLNFNRCWYDRGYWDDFWSFFKGLQKSSKEACDIRDNNKNSKTLGVCSWTLKHQKWIYRRMMKDYYGEKKGLSLDALVLSNAGIDCFMDMMNDQGQKSKKYKFTYKEKNKLRLATKADNPWVKFIPSA